MELFPLDEVKRKTFHLLTGIYIAAYWFLPYRVVLAGLGTFLVLVIIGETVRLHNPWFNSFILNALGGVHRDGEQHTVSGLPWTISGSFLTMLLFHDKYIVLASLLFLAIGDALAALVGRRFGKHKILGQKTLEGSLACFSACLVIGLFLLPWKLALIGAAFVTLIELVPWPLNDNFWMPLLSALALTLLSTVI